MIDRVPSWLSVFVVTLVAVFRLTPTLAFLGPSSFLCESSPSTLFATRSTKSRDDSTAEIVLPNRTQSSNFWYSVVRKDSEDVGKIPKLPVVRHLDKDGHLPPGAYRQFGREQYETKQTCALSIAVDLFWPFGGELVDSNEVVSGMQKFIDSGLTSFHLGLPSQSAAPKPKSQSANRRGEEVSETIELLCPSILQTWGEENIFGRLQRSIPASVMKSCHLVIPLMTPSRKAHANHVTKSLVRQAVTESIGRIGTDSIDTLQLQYCEDSPFHLEMMDHLVELQRDGLIKSIAGKGFTPMALRDLDRNGFRFDSHEMDINLLNSNHYYNAESKLAAADLDLPLLASSPLAGGLLTSRWHGKVYPPLSREMASPQQHKYILTALRKWCHTQQQTPSKSAPLSELQVWDQYQKKVLPLLDEISQYHEVSLASIALRWALQLDHVGNTAVRCNLMKEDEDIQGNLSRRLKHLRDVFRFELSGEDMDRLGELSKSPQSDMEKAMDEEEEELRRMMRNRSLWL